MGPFSSPTIPRSAHDKKASTARIPWLGVFLASLISVSFTGCATSSDIHAPRQFEFSRDTFSYPNELVWQYRYDPESDKMLVTPSDPPPDYSHHCFVMARATREFFFHAAFLPEEPRLAAREYEARVEAVISRSSQELSPPGERVRFPGYASFRDFSREHESLLKEHCGGAWRCYLQRGNWRLIFPFTGAGQAQTAERLVQSLEMNRPVIAHLGRFPNLDINHAVVLFDWIGGGDRLHFLAYDPNIPAEPVILTFDQAERRFEFPATHYFRGGEVRVYEAYRGWCF